MELHLKTFLKAHADWDNILRQAPYYLKISYSDNFVLFKYDQLNSDMSHPIVQEARGIIFDINTLEPVCIPFFKFFNYGEANAAEIDWSTARVQEKIDGSLIKLWYYADQWHISTNGTIDAHDAPASDTQSFYDLFMEALSPLPPLDKDATHMFELCHPVLSHVVPCHAPQLHYLGSRNNTTLQEYSLPFLETPRTYNLTNIDDTIAVVNEMNETHEGVVVCDAAYHRIKVKSPTYLIKRRAANNGAITTKLLLKMRRLDILDDFVAALPQYADTVNNLNAILLTYAENLEAKYQNILAQNLPTMKEIAAVAGPDIHYVSARYNGKVLSPSDYINRLTLDKQLQILRGADFQIKKETT